jgi:hypothetical protein
MKNYKPLKEKYNLTKEQYNKMRDTINSCETPTQCDSARRMLKNLSNWWVSEKALIKPFSFKEISEPATRINELEKLLIRKLNQILFPQFNHLK